MQTQTCPVALECRYWVSSIIHYFKTYIPICIDFSFVLFAFLHLHIILSYAFLPFCCLSVSVEWFLGVFLFFFSRLPLFWIDAITAAKLRRADTIHIGGREKFTCKTKKRVCRKIEEVNNGLAILQATTHTRASALPLSNGQKRWMKNKREAIASAKPNEMARAKWSTHIAYLTTKRTTGSQQQQQRQWTWLQCRVHSLSTSSSSSSNNNEEIVQPSHFYKRMRFMYFLLLLLLHFNSDPFRSFTCLKITKPFIFFNFTFSDRCCWHTNTLWMKYK